MDKPWFGLHGNKSCLLYMISVMLAICMMVGTLNYLHHDIFACYGQLGAGFPIAFVCDYSAGGSPLSSAGKIDEADFPFLSPSGTIVDMAFYLMAVWFGWLTILGISRSLHRWLQSR